MISKSHFILYVENQSESTEFYSKLLNQEPTLNVPGMTEFKLTEKSVLGLMPSRGIKKLLKNKIDTLVKSDNIIKSELYLIVKNIEEYIQRVASEKIKILSELKERDWNHKVIYLLDPDNYVIALAELMVGSND